MSPPPGRRVRTITFVTAMLCGLVGFGAMSDAFEGVRPIEPSDLPETLEPHKRQLLIRASEAEFAAQQRMKTARRLTLWPLSVVCMLGFISALRMLRPNGVSREGMRRVLVLALVLAAVLRTVDGAQAAVISGRVGKAIAEEAAKHPELLVTPHESLDADKLAQQFLGLGPKLVTAASILWTALIAGGFALLWQYFRSPRAREQIAAWDAQGA